MTTKKTGRSKSGTKKLKIKKETLKDLDPKKGKRVKGGAVRLAAAAFTDFGQCDTQGDCPHPNPFTYGGQVTCQSVGACPPETFKDCYTQACATSACRLR